MSNIINKRIQKRYFTTEKASDSTLDFPNNPEIDSWTEEVLSCLSGNWDDIIQHDIPSDVHGVFVRCLEDPNSKVYKRFRSILRDALEKSAILCADEHGY